MPAMFSIAKREIRSYFDSPIAYVVICLGLLILGFWFFDMGGFWKADRASLQQMFTLAPRGLSFLIIPVITMRLVAEEKRSGTLEMLITLPVKDRDVILGKFLGAWALVLILILTTALYPIMMFKWPWDLGALDTGPVVSGYLGLILYSAAATAIGLLISSLAGSQIIALFITFIVLLLLHVISGFSSIAELPPKVQFVIAFFSFDSRLAPFVRGLVNLRDVIYFLSITTGCLVGSFWALERRKWN